MPSAAPISGVGVARAVLASFGGTVNERLRIAALRVVCALWSGVDGAVAGILSLILSRKCETLNPSVW